MKYKPDYHQRKKNYSIMTRKEIVSGKNDFSPKFTMPCIMPVSYTHLDVYKRQVERFMMEKKRYDTWNEEDEAAYQLYLQEQDIEKRTYRTWYLIANPRNLPKEFVQQELEFRFKLFSERKKEKK